MKALDFLLQFDLPMSVEKPCTPASKSEVRRWFDQKSVQINGESIAWNEEIDFPIISLVLFPKSTVSKGPGRPARRCTLW